MIHAPGAIQGRCGARGGLGGVLLHKGGIWDGSYVCDQMGGGVSLRVK